MPRPKSPTPKYGFYRSTNKKTGITYLYMSRSEWDPEKKQPRIKERHHVGALDADSRVHVSPKFIAKFPQYENAAYFTDGKLMDADTFFSQYATTDAKLFEEVTRVSTQRNEEDFVESALGGNVRSFGAVYALLSISTQTGIYKSLKEVFGHDGDHLLAMAMFKIINPMAYQIYAQWHLDNLITFAEPLSSQRCSEVHAAVTDELIGAYWQHRSRQRKLSRVDGMPDICVLDATSISTYSRSIENADYGHNKQGEDLRQINLTVVCDQYTGEVLYAKERNGSIPDIASLRDLLADMTRQEITGRDVVLVMDRGYDSSINIEKMLGNETHFLIGAKDSDAGIRMQMSRHMKQLQNYAFHNPQEKLFMATYHDKNWGEGSAVKGRTEFPNGVYLHMYRDPFKAVDLLSALDAKIKALMDKLNKQDNPERFSDEEDRRLARKALRLGKDENRKSVWSFDSDKFAELAKYEGCWALWSDVFSDPAEALSQYRKRNIVEQGFNVHKNILQGDRLRCTETTYRGRLFVHLLAQSLVMILYHRVYESRRGRPKSIATEGVDLDGNSLPLLLEKLRLIKAKRVAKDSDAWLVDQLSKKQRELFENILKIKLPPRITS